MYSSYRLYEMHIICHKDETCFSDSSELQSLKMQSLRLEILIAL